MKILHYIPVYAPAWQWGGPVRSVSGLCEGLAARGHEVKVFTTNAGLEDDPTIRTTEPVSRNGVRVHYFPRVPGYGIKSPALEEAVKRRAAEFELIHVTAIWQRTGPAACRAARAAGVPYVISSRGALSPYSWRRGRGKKIVWYWLRERGSLKHAAGFHYTSKMEAAECERFRFGKPSCVVPNPIDLEFWRADKESAVIWRRKLGIGEQEVVLLYAGRLHHKKGLDLLPPVLRGCIDAGIPARLVLIGSDEDGTGRRLWDQMVSLAVTDRTIILPAQSPEELRAAYSGSDVFLFPSLHENFGNVAVEAAACGCRVVMSDQVGVGLELVELGWGTVLDRVAGSWVRAIATRPDKTAAARNTLVEKFGNDSTAARMEEFYRGICRGSGEAFDRTSPTAASVR